MTAAPPRTVFNWALWPLKSWNRTYWYSPRTRILGVMAYSRPKPRATPPMVLVRAFAVSGVGAYGTVWAPCPAGVELLSGKFGLKLA